MKLSIKEQYLKDERELQNITDSFDDNAIETLQAYNIEVEDLKMDNGTIYAEYTDGSVYEIEYYNNQISVERIV